MHLFLSNSILPFTQTLSFFVIMLFYRWFKSHFFLSKLYSTVPNPNLPFLKYASFLSNSILPFTQTLSFFVKTLFYHSFHSHFILSRSYSTVRSNPIFFCLHPILPFIESSYFFVLNLILFYF